MNTTNFIEFIPISKMDKVFGPKFKKILIKITQLGLTFIVLGIFGCVPRQI